MLREEGRTSWGLGMFSPDAVEPCSHGFLRLYPHGALNMCFPE